MKEINKPLNSNMEDEVVPQCSDEYCHSTHSDGSKSQVENLSLLDSHIVMKISSNKLDTVTEVAHVENTNSDHNGNCSDQKNFSKDSHIGLNTDSSDLDVINNGFNTFNSSDVICENLNVDCLNPQSNNSSSIDSHIGPNTNGSDLNVVTDDTKTNGSDLDVVTDDPKTNGSDFDVVTDDTKTNGSDLDVVPDDTKTNSSDLDPVTDRNTSSSKVDIVTNSMNINGCNVDSVKEAEITQFDNTDDLEDDSDFEIVSLELVDEDNILLDFENCSSNDQDDRINSSETSIASLPNSLTVDGERRADCLGELPESSTENCLTTQQNSRADMDISKMSDNSISNSITLEADKISCSIKQENERGDLDTNEIFEATISNLRLMVNHFEPISEDSSTKQEQAILDIDIHDMPYASISKSADIQGCNGVEQSKTLNSVQENSSDKQIDVDVSEVFEATISNMVIMVEDSDTDDGQHKNMNSVNTGVTVKVETDSDFQSEYFDKDQTLNSFIKDKTLRNHSELDESVLKIKTEIVDSDVQRSCDTSQNMSHLTQPIKTKQVESESVSTLKPNNSVSDLRSNINVPCSTKPIKTEAVENDVSDLTPKNSVTSLKSNNRVSSQKNIFELFGMPSYKVEAVTEEDEQLLSISSVLEDKADILKDTPLFAQNRSFMSVLLQESIKLEGVYDVVKTDPSDNDDVTMTTGADIDRGGVKNTSLANQCRVRLHPLSGDILTELELHGFILSSDVLVQDSRHGNKMASESSDDELDESSSDEWDPETDHEDPQELMEDLEKKKPYACLCGKRFPNVSKLKRHETTHDSTRAYTCDVCGKSFKTQISLDCHEQVHINYYDRDPLMNQYTKTGPRQYKCKLCKKVLESKFGVRYHLFSHNRDIECNICGLKFDSMIEKIKHSKTHGDKPHSCDVCGKSFKKINELRRHESTHQKKTLQCALCPKKFSCALYLKIHKKQKHGEKIHACDHCSMKFSSLQILKSHQIVHSNKFPHQCTQCQKKFKYLPSFKEHEARHRRNKYQCSVCPDNFKVESSLHRHMCIHTGNTPFQCEVCQYTSKSFRDYEKHKRVHTGERPYQCDVCSKSFSTSSVLSTHKITHTTTRFPCDKCTKTFTCKGTLNLHKKIHTGEVNVHCDACDLSFCSKNSYQIHMRIAHAIDDTFKCQYCQKICGSASLLNVHTRMHTDERPKKCEICKKRFRNARDLRMHVMTHTGEKPHQCEFCGQKFVQIVALISHRRRRHSKTDNRIFKCEICPARLSDKDSLTKHYNLHTKSHTCKTCRKCFGSARSLRSHENTHNPNFIFPCPICKRLFNKVAERNMHKKTCKNKTPGDYSM